MKDQIFSIVLLISFLCFGCGSEIIDPFYYLVEPGVSKGDINTVWFRGNELTKARLLVSDTKLQLIRGSIIEEADLSGDSIITNYKLSYTTGHTLFCVNGTTPSGDNIFETFSAGKKNSYSLGGFFGYILEYTCSCQGNMCLMQYITTIETRTYFSDDTGETWKERENVSGLLIGNEFFSYDQNTIRRFEYINGEYLEMYQFNDVLMPFNINSFYYRYDPMTYCISRYCFSEYYNSFFYENDSLTYMKLQEVNGTIMALYETETTSKIVLLNRTEYIHEETIVIEGETFLSSYRLVGQTIHEVELGFRYLNESTPSPPTPSSSNMLVQRNTILIFFVLVLMF